MIPELGDDVAWCSYGCFFVPKTGTPLFDKKESTSTYRRVRMRRAEFSMLRFTNSLEENYFCQIADVVVPAGATPATIFWLPTLAPLSGAHLQLFGRRG